VLHRVQGRQCSKHPGRVPPELRDL
jgi:hypothetical protein